MEISYVLLDEENRGDFDSVFPEEIKLGPNRVAIGAVNEDAQVVGCISYCLMDYQYDIDWIYVEEAVRRQGIGIGLIDEVLKVVTGTGDLFPVSAMFEFSEKNDVMHTFFLSCVNMDTEYSHERYYVTADDVRNSAALHRSKSTEFTTGLFFDRPIEEQKRILARLAVEETYAVIDYESWKSACVPELCRCVYVRKELVDLVFMQKLPDGNLELSYLYGKYPKGLFDLLSDTVKEMERLYPEARLSFDAVTNESRQLADHLFPKANKVHVYEASFL